MFSALRSRLESLRTAPARVAAAAAPRIAAQLQEDSTTRRGNVPSYGKFGDVPSTAVPSGSGITVRAADWVMSKARELDQPAEWVGIVGDTAREVIGGGE